MCPSAVPANTSAPSGDDDTLWTAPCTFTVASSTHSLPSPTYDATVPSPPDTTMRVSSGAVSDNTPPLQHDTKVWSDRLLICARAWAATPTTTASLWVSRRYATMQKGTGNGSTHADAGKVAACGPCVQPLPVRREQQGCVLALVAAGGHLYTGKFAGDRVKRPQ